MNNKKIIEETRFTSVKLVDGEMGIFSFKGEFTVPYTDEVGTFEIPRVLINPSINKHRGIAYFSNEILASNGGELFTFEYPEHPPKEMTMDEIEKELGYKIKVVNK